MYAAVSATSDPCGTWSVARISFSGGPFTTGTVITDQVLGQNRGALLVGTAETTAGTTAYSAFAIPKAGLYSAAPVSFPTFTMPTMSTPASAAGIPIIDGSDGYFLAVTPGTAGTAGNAYTLYVMANSAGSAPQLNPFISFSISGAAPGEVGEPGGGTLLSSPFLETPPVFDGKYVWFTQAVDDPGFMPIPATVVYGRIQTDALPGPGSVVVRNNTAGSFFNSLLDPSIGVGRNTDGSESVFVNYAYTGVSSDLPVTSAVKSFASFFGASPSDFGGVQDILIGANAKPSRAEFAGSSVAIDPSVTDGTCAVLAQEYFSSGGDWDTRLARVCGATDPARVPGVIGESLSDAVETLSSRQFVPVPTSTSACPASANLKVIATSPAPGVPVPYGSTVTVTQCLITSVTVPNVIGDSLADATAALQAAGLVKGDVNFTTSCDVRNGQIADTTPGPGTTVAFGAAVTLYQSTGKPKNPCN
jgi:hypothetical protein